VSYFALFLFLFSFRSSRFAYLYSPYNQPSPSYMPMNGNRRLKKERGHSQKTMEATPNTGLNGGISLGI
jgi:hypothetical protein